MEKMLFRVLFYYAYITKTQAFGHTITGAANLSVDPPLL